MADSEQSRITDDQVRRVAHLARLHLSDDEVERMKKDMDAILGFVQKLSDLQLDDVEPTAHAVDMGLALCDDAPTEHLGMARSLQGAPEVAEGHFVVPKVL